MLTLLAGDRGFDPEPRRPFRARVLGCTARLPSEPGHDPIVVYGRDLRYVVTRYEQRLSRFSALSASGVVITAQVRYSNHLRVSQCLSHHVFYVVASLSRNSPHIVFCSLHMPVSSEMRFITRAKRNMSFWPGVWLSEFG
jgi:hypothetical protein